MNGYETEGSRLKFYMDYEPDAMDDARPHTEPGARHALPAALLAWLAGALAAAYFCKIF